MTSRPREADNLWKTLVLGTAMAFAVAVPVGVGMLNAPRLHAQSPAAGAPPLAFDVASVKPNKSVDTRRRGTLQPGRFSQTNVTLQQLIQMAYPEQIVGGPSWVGVDRFDVDAKGDFELSGFLPGPDGSPPRAYVMLRTLLADRFKLKVRNETRTLPVYALQTARSDGKLGPQLRRADVDCAALMAAIAKSGQMPVPSEPGKAPTCGGNGAPGRIIFNGVSMLRLTGVLSQFVNRPVVDRTNLTGDFVLELQWAPEQPQPPDAGRSDTSQLPGDLPSIFTAPQEQLGLKLESTRGPVEVLVIDSVEQPAPN